MQKHPAAGLTYEDSLQFPDDGLRHEILEGEHCVTPPPAVVHQRILLNLSYLLRQHLDTHPAGEVLFAPVDVLLSRFNILQPDLIYVSTERSHQFTSQNLQGAPDLAVEILSPSTRSRDLHLKRKVYRETGVLEYWIVDPEEQSVTVHRRHAPTTEYRSGSSLTTALLPGFAVPIEKLFPTEVKP